MAGEPLIHPKIDFHGPGTGCGQRLRLLTAQGKVSCVKSVDSAGWAWEAATLAKSSGVAHVVIFRQTAPGELANDHPDLGLEPDEAARRLWTAVLATMPPELVALKDWLYIEPINEPGLPNEAQAAWVGRFCVAIAKLMLADGWRPALAGFNAGTPSREQMRDHFADLLRLMADNHERMLWTHHEAKLPYGDKQHLTHLSPLDEFRPWLIDSSQILFEVCDELAVRRPRAFVSESAWSYRDIPPEAQFRAEVEALARLDALRPEVVGRVIWNVSPGGQWGSLRDKLNNEHSGWLTQFVTTAMLPAGEEPKVIDDDKRPLGLDVSRWQTDIDWQAAYAAGARFVFVRSSDGGSRGEPYADYRYRPHFDGAFRAGFLIGTYHLLRNTNPQRQAEFVAKIYDQRCTLPPVVDVEPVIISGKDYDSVKHADVVRQYCVRFEELAGIRPIIYTAGGIWNKLPGDKSWAERYELWAANYRTGDTFPASAAIHQWSLEGRPWLPGTWAPDKWTFWQYTSQGKIDGYPNRLDMNRFNGTLEELRAYSQRFLDGQQQQRPSLAVQLWQISIEEQIANGLHLNAAAGLQQAIAADGGAGLQIVTNEAEAKIDGVAYRYQVAEGSERRVYAYELPAGQIFIVTDPEQPPVEPPPAPEPPPVATIDLLPYMRGDGRMYEVRHSDGRTETFQSQTGENGRFYQVKNSQWEAFAADDQFIWRGVDTSPGPAPRYAERPGALRYYIQYEYGDHKARWCKRHMTVGETFTGGGHRAQFYYKDDCKLSAANSGPATNVVTLVAQHAQMTWHGIAITDVVELKTNTGETMWYGRGFGLVAWKNSQGGQSAVVELLHGRPALKREQIGCL